MPFRSGPDRSVERSSLGSACHGRLRCVVLSMSQARVFLLLAIGSCAIDDRVVTVPGVCVTPGAGGLVSDFSAAVEGHCSPDICPNDEESPTVSLGVGNVMGLVFPYRSTGLNAVTLTPTSDMSAGDAGFGQALRAAMVSGLPPAAPLLAHDGFALQFLDRANPSTLGACVDISNFSAISFTTGGNLGNCTLRFSVQFNAGAFRVPCAIDTCPAPNIVLDAAGTATLALPGNFGVGRPTALAGMQWEFRVPTDRAGGCTADFTIDDIRLIP